MIFGELNHKISRVQYAMDAVDNLHGGEDCPEVHGYCQNCDEKIIAVWDRMAELPWWMRAGMWISAPWSWRSFKQEVEEARAAMTERDELRAQ